MNGITISRAGNHWRHLSKNHPPKKNGRFGWRINRKWCPKEMDRPLGILAMDRAASAAAVAWHWFFANHCDEHRTRTKQPATYRKAIAPIVFDWWFLNVVVSLGLRWVVSSLKKNETDLHRKCLFCSWELVETTHDTLTKQITSHFRFTHMISDRGDILIPSSLSHAPLSRNKICIKLSISIMYICIYAYIRINHRFCSYLKCYFLPKKCRFSELTLSFCGCGCSTEHLYNFCCGGWLHKRMAT